MQAFLSAGRKSQYRDSADGIPVCNISYVAASLNCPGVMPIMLLKMRIRTHRLEKPTLAAISSSVSVVVCSSSFAASIRTE